MKVHGVVKPLKKGAAVLCDIQTVHSNDRNIAFISSKFLKKYNLTPGAYVTAETRKGRPLPAVTNVEEVNGMSPDDFARRSRFRDLIAIDPHERFDLDASGDISMRVMDIVAPIAKGTRGLIVSPPKAGKTMLLESLAHAIKKSTPDTRIITLLIDERPEEVTAFRRNVDAEVLASSNDQSTEEHITLCEMVMNMIKVELECRRDVVVLVDSLTRMGRAFNVSKTTSGRVLTGGLDSGALEIPRRFFGMARTAENGGSVTIIATALVNTGSRMDDFIFQEFKGTGNSELVLDRSLAEQRLFPAVNISASGTRKEELLYDEEDIEAVRLIRRGLANRQPDDALKVLLSALSSHPTNKILFTHVLKEYAAR